MLEAPCRQAGIMPMLLLKCCCVSSLQNSDVIITCKLAMHT